MFTLGRKIDLRYKPNLIIVLAALIVVAAGWLISGEFSLRNLTRRGILFDLGIL